MELLAIGGSQLIAEAAKRLARVERLLVLAPYWVGFGIAAGDLPACLADRVAGKAVILVVHIGDAQSEAMIGVGLPAPIAAAFGKIAEALLAFAQRELGATLLFDRTLDLRHRVFEGVARVALGIGDHPLSALAFDGARLGL